MADEYYNNKIVTTDGDVLMDLTQDTATPETVLEGETFHLRSGASAVGTYRPSDEIEARLEATVGHSSKNLFDISGQNSINYGVRWYEENGRLRAVGTYNDNAAHSQPRFYAKLKAGSYIFSGSPIYSETGIRILIGTCLDEQGTNFTALGYDEGNGFTFTLQSDSWVSIRMYTAKNLYKQSIDLTLPVMLRDGSISDDTFEPYVTPTDEKKQDKPVVLWEGDVTTNLTVNIGDNSYYSHYILTGISSVKTDRFAEVEDPAIFTVIIHSDMPGSYCAPYYEVYAILTISYQSSQGVTDIVIDNPKNLKLNKIIGIPK